MIKRWLMGLALLISVAGAASAQMAFVEGTDYQAISPAVKTTQPDKIVVTEIFSYYCPHCFRFEPYVERWAAGLPDGVVFEQVPSSSPPLREVARAYYAFKMMGAHEQTHKALFETIHVKRQRIRGLDDLAKFAAGQGLDEKVFREDAVSFPVETQLSKNKKKEIGYGLSGVPAVIVNGKYLVSASLAGSFERMIQIMNFLVAHELAQ
jgi:thiol:disulfide interchange protein DsbA